MNKDLQARYENLENQIDKACKRVQRNFNEICLVVASKDQSVEAIYELYCLGQRDFGENYAEELEKKKKELKNLCPKIRWHFIGNIQSNKIKKIAQVDIVHSLSSLKHAKALANYQTSEKPLRVFLQVKLSFDQNRSGKEPENIKKLYDEISELRALKILGLMVILPLDLEPEEGFLQISQLRNDLEKQGCHLPELSMGMSSDFPVAIKYGATFIRIGTSLFGDRNK